MSWTRVVQGGSVNSAAMRSVPMSTQPCLVLVSTAIPHLLPRKNTVRRRLRAIFPTQGNSGIVQQGARRLAQGKQARCPRDSSRGNTRRNLSQISPTSTRFRHQNSTLCRLVKVKVIHNNLKFNNKVTPTRKRRPTYYYRVLKT